MRGEAVGIPGRYALPIAVMKEMGWGWSQFLEAPADLVEEIATRLQKDVKWGAKRREMEKARERTTKGKRGGR